MTIILRFAYTLTCLLADLLICLLGRLAYLGSLALIHIDADAYESVLDALDTLYPCLSMYRNS